MTGGPIFVFYVLVCKNCSTFFFDKQLALPELGTETYAALPLENNLFRHTFSDFERDPSSIVFRCGILVDNKFRWILICFQYVEITIWNIGNFFALVRTQSLQKAFGCLVYLKKNFSD